MSDVEHAQKYRSRRIMDLIEALMQFPPTWEVFPHPVTGNYVVHKGGDWRAIIDKEGVMNLEDEDA